MTLALVAGGFAGFTPQMPDFGGSSIPTWAAEADPPWKAGDPAGASFRALERPIVSPPDERPRIPLTHSGARRRGARGLRQVRAVARGLLRCADRPGEHPGRGGSGEEEHHATRWLRSGDRR